MENTHFKFNLSLSILNHLGRNLYRSFVTVLGEAVSNSWDADAKNVRIYIDRKNNSLIVKDDGIGMNKEDFQNKFLTIGYSKRKNNENKSPSGRPYIGRKGNGNSINHRKVDDWINSLREDAEFNFTSYAECFISENLIRKYLVDINIKLSEDDKKLINDYKENGK